MMTEQRPFPPIPKIGMPDAFYTNAIHQAEAEGDAHTKEVLKVARYISLALNPKMSWEEKLRHFQHALQKHCNPPSHDEDVVNFYKQLQELVREYAGAEALRMASAEDDMYAARAAISEDRTSIEEDAELFFGRLISSGEHRPEHFNQVDWDQLKLIREQWI